MFSQNLQKKGGGGESGISGGSEGGSFFNSYCEVSIIWIPKQRRDITKKTKTKPIKQNLWTNILCEHRHKTSQQNTRT